ncbi:MAG: hypothetical protein PHP92_04900 [Candidatus Nanoarchaeia archaeon]|nr:hypothetical protein [Candidatus Nanoarchaeia archaeon]
MAVSLVIQTKTTEHFIIVGKEWCKINVNVTANGKALQGATVTFSILSGGTGTIQPVSTTTDAYGYAEARFKADAVSYYNIGIVAVKSPYTSVSDDVDILSYEQPTIYTQNGILYLSLIEQKKIDILKTLSKVLDNDLDISTGSGVSDKIAYMTEWNYAIRNFPLIVASNSGARHKQMGINPVIDNDTRGNFVEQTFELNVVAENKNILDRITEKCIFILSTYKYYELYEKYGIQIIPNGISVGALVTEEYGSKYLYANKISISTQLEMVYTIVPDDEIDDFNYDMNITSGIT